MLHELGSPAEMTAEELYATYLRRLADAAADVDAAETGLAPETIDAIREWGAAGEGGGENGPAAPELTVEEAAAVLAPASGSGVDPDEMVALARDALLMGMSNAVLDVDALASGLEGELEPREIQSKVEGRLPMTLREFARFQAHLQSRTRG